jgi:hypothetical protein
MYPPGLAAWMHPSALPVVPVIVEAVPVATTLRVDPVSDVPRIERLT